MEIQSLGFIGGGRITRIFLVAFKKAGVAIGQVRVFDPQESVLAALKNQFPEIVASATDISGAAGAGIVFLAVHPPMMLETLAKINGVVNPDAILISLAPKFTIRKCYYGYAMGYNRNTVQFGVDL